MLSEATVMGARRPLRRTIGPRRYAVWLAVVLVHVTLIAAILISHPQKSRGHPNSGRRLTLLQLPDAERRTEKFALRIDPGPAKLNINADTPKAINPITDNAISVLPSEQQQLIDWEHESALAVQSSISQAAKERSYRDLSSLTTAQLDWIKKNHMEPVPGFQWDQSSRGELLRHGIVKINDYCVLVVVIPFCRFGGKIQYNGDLFKDMPGAKDQ